MKIKWPWKKRTVTIVAIEFERENPEAEVKKKPQASKKTVASEKAPKSPSRKKTSNYMPVLLILAILVLVAWVLLGIVYGCNGCYYGYGTVNTPTITTTTTTTPPTTVTNTTTTTTTTPPTTVTQTAPAPPPITITKTVTPTTPPAISLPTQKMVNDYGRTFWVPGPGTSRDVLTQTLRGEFENMPIEVWNNNGAIFVVVQVVEGRFYCGSDNNQFLLKQPVPQPSQSTWLYTVPLK